MKKFIVSGLLALFASLQFTGVSYAGVPLNNLEGVGGIAFNPLAYLANAGSKWKKAPPAAQAVGAEKKDFSNYGFLENVSKPQAGAWYVRLPEAHVDWTALGTAFSLYDRVEVSYGWEAVAPHGGQTIYKNNIGTKFKSGFSISEIAEERCLSTNTIETHLARFIESGEVKVGQLVQAHKIEPIKKAILKLKSGGAAGPVKEFLGE